MKILDYNTGFGSLSSGFEHFSQNEVVEAVKIAQSEEYGYNSCHKTWFPRRIRTLDAIEDDFDFDLGIFRPEIGGKVARKSFKNFSSYDFEQCLAFLKRTMPKFAIFQTEVEAISLLNTADSYVKDGFGQKSKDIVIKSLQNMGYDAYLMVLDEADYGIPIHREFAFYIATPKNFSLGVPKPLFTKTGRGQYSKYRTVAEAIGDLSNLGEYVSYSSPPQNAFQRYLRNPNGKVTHNFISVKLRESIRKRIPSIKQGSNNESPIPNNRSKGYNRAKWDDICRCSSPQMYLVTDKKGDGIHPLQNRPFTIREICRLHGLPDSLSFELKTSAKDICSSIYTSPAPAIGELLSMAMGVVD